LAHTQPCALKSMGSSLLRHVRSRQLCALLCDLLLYYGLVLSEGLLNLLISEFALLNLQLALVFQSVDLLQEHLSALFLLLVDLVRAERLLNLLLDLREFHLAFLHHILRHVLVIMLQFTNWLQLLNVCIYLHFVRTLILITFVLDPFEYFCFLLRHLSVDLFIKCVHFWIKSLSPLRKWIDLFLHFAQLIQVFCSEPSQDQIWLGSDLVTEVRFSIFTLLYLYFE